MANGNGDRGEEAARKALDAVAEAVRVSHEATGEAATLVKPDTTVEDFGKLSAEPLLKFCEAAAVHIEQVGQEVLTDGQKLSDSCVRLAGDIRQVAKEQAAAIVAATTRTRKAANALTAIRDEFRGDIARELETLEKAKPTPEAKTG